VGHQLLLGEGWKSRLSRWSCWTISRGRAPSVQKGRKFPSLLTFPDTTPVGDWNILLKQVRKSTWSLLVGKRVRTTTIFVLFPSLSLRLLCVCVCVFLVSLIFSWEKKKMRQKENVETLLLSSYTPPLSLHLSDFFIRSLHNI
jgi:hypothetical protein